VFQMALFIQTDLGSIPVINPTAQKMVSQSTEPGWPNSRGLERVTVFRCR
jgi:hypothetical protein